MVHGTRMAEPPVEVLPSDTAAPPITREAYVAPLAGTERVLAETLAEIVGVDRVSVQSHFFDDLGADSLVMARFCARVRKRTDLRSVSMKDVYRHSTVRSLAAALTDAAGPASVEPPVPVPVEATTEPASRAQYVLCGTLQLLFFLGYAYLAALDRRRGRTSGSPPAPARSTSTCGRSRSVARASSACARSRSWPSGSSSVGGSPSRSASGASATSASGSSRRWSG